MISSRTTSLLFAAVLALSVGGKLLANRTVAEPDSRLFASEARGLLETAGYRVVAQQRSLGAVVHGRKPGCAIMIADYSPYGTFADHIAELAAPIGPLHYRFRGASRETAPKIRPLTEYYIQRELRRIGIAARRTPIAAVAASNGCQVESLRWSRLASLPR